MIIIAVLETDLPQPCTKPSTWSAKIKNIWCGEPQFAKLTIKAIQTKDTISNTSVTILGDVLLQSFCGPAGSSVIQYQVGWPDERLLWAGELLNKSLL